MKDTNEPQGPKTDEDVPQRVTIEIDGKEDDVELIERATQPPQSVPSNIIGDADVEDLN